MPDEATGTPALRTVYRDGAFRPDTWVFVADGEPLPAQGDLVLRKDRFLAEAQALRNRNGAIGIYLDPGETLEGVVEHLDRITLVVLRFAKYSDGRPYSTARLLRDRYGFSGELRATGDVLRDQIDFMRRAGFDALEVAHAGTRKALESGAIVAVRRHYQPASNEDGERKSPEAPWRRVSS